MKIINTKIKGLKIIKTNIYKDKRGFLKEVFRKNILNNKDFPFDVMSYSKKNVLRGLHIQTTKSQAKIITVTHGKIFDVAVDLRKGSKTFAKYYSLIISDRDDFSFFIPEGFAHGFLVLSEHAKFQYKVTDYWYPEAERCIAFDDPGIGIKWPLDCINMANPQVSEKDRAGKLFKDAEIFTQ